MIIMHEEGLYHYYLLLKLIIMMCGGSLASPFSELGRIAKEVPCSGQSKFQPGLGKVGRSL